MRKFQMRKFLIFLINSCAFFVRKTRPKIKTIVITSGKAIATIAIPPRLLSKLFSFSKPYPVGICKVLANSCLSKEDRFTIPLIVLNKRSALAGIWKLQFKFISSSS